MIDVSTEMDRFVVGWLVAAVLDSLLDGFK